MLEEFPEDMPEWAKLNPALAMWWLEIESFLIVVKTMGGDSERARERAMKLIQEGMNLEEAKLRVLREIAMGEIIV